MTYGTTNLDTLTFLILKVSSGFRINAVCIEIIAGVRLLCSLVVVFFAMSCIYRLTMNSVYKDMIK